MELSVLFLIAIAIRKFKKLKSIIFTFDKQVALNNLKCFCNDGFFRKEEHFSRLAYYVRKFNLTFEDLSSIGFEIINVFDKHLKDNSLVANDKTINSLCSSLKYLSQNSDEKTNPLEISWIVQLIEATCNRPPIKNELVLLLLHCLEKLQIGKLNSDESSKLQFLIENMPDLNQDVKALIIEKLESNKIAEMRDEYEKERFEKSMAVRKMKKNQQVVTKTIQTVKAQQEIKSSEEIEFELLDLSCLKNRRTRLNQEIYLEMEQKEYGSDLSESGTD